MSNNKTEEQAELRLKVEQVLHLAVADLGMSVLFRDSDPVKTGVGDKNAPYYWTDKLIDLVSAEQKEKWEKEITSKIKVAYETARAATGTEEGRKAIDFFYSVHLNSWPGIAHLSSKEQGAK